MDKAAANGQLEVVKFLHESRTDGCTTRAMNEEASNGHLNLVKFLHEHRKEGCTEKAMNGAAGGGHLEVVRFLHTSRSEGCTEYAMEAAIRHLEVAKYLEDNHCCSGDWPNVAIAAAQTGDLAAVRFVCTHLAEDVSAAALLYAGGESLLEMIKIFEEFNVDGWTSTVMDYAAGVGNLDAVKYLHMHRTKGCSTDAMDKAATNGHLEVLRFLHEYRTEGCTKAAMDGAAGAANLEIQRFLQQERPEGCTSDAICQAAKSGDIQVLEFILSHYDLSIPETAALSGAKGGHWDILVRLLRLNPPDDLVEISHTLAAEGHLSIIKRLCKASAIDQPIVQSCIVQAAENGHWYVVKFLLSQVTDALLGYDWFTEAIEAASLFADYDMMVLLMSAKRCFSPSRAHGLINIAIVGDLDLLDLLEANRLQRRDYWNNRDADEDNVMVEQLFEDTGLEWRKVQFAAAAAHGHLEILYRLRQFRPQRFVSDVLTKAVMSCGIDAIRFLRSTLRISANYADFLMDRVSERAVAAGAIRTAIRCGNLNALRHLHLHRQRGTFKADDFDAAVASNSYDMVKFVYDNCSKEHLRAPSVDSAAGHGNLDIVRFVHEKKVEGFTHAAMDNAAMEKALTVLHFLH